MSDRLVDQIAEALNSEFGAHTTCEPGCTDAYMEREQAREVAAVALGVVRDAVKALDLPWCGHCGSTQAVLALLDGGAS